MKVIILVFMSLSLFSCGSVGKLIPSFAYDKGNQSTSSSDTLSQSVGYANASLSAGDNKGRNYNKSNLKSKDLNSDSRNNQQESSYSIGGTHTNKSRKNIYTNTEHTSNKDNYNADSIYQYSQKLSGMIINFLDKNITAVLMVLSFWLGGKSMQRKIKKQNKIK